MEKAISAVYHVGKNWEIDKRRYNPHKVNFMRYVDDFIVTANSEETTKELAELIKEFLMELGLELSEEKTHITHLYDGFNFLGWNFRKYRGKLRIDPSKKSIGNISRKIGDVVKQAKVWKQEYLINVLNLIITGWSNYHRSAISKETFSKLDHIIWDMLWGWAKRRHPNKRNKWVKRRYGILRELGTLMFSTKENRLKPFTDTKIVRCTVLKLDKNPFTDQDHFNLRNRCPILKGL